jgi:hypothetical protein
MSINTCRRLAALFSLNIAWLALFPLSARADTLNVVYLNNPPGVNSQSCITSAGEPGPPGIVYDSVASGTATASTTCATPDGNGSITLSGSAAVGMLGGSITSTGGGDGSLAAYFSQNVTFTGVGSTVNCPEGNGTVECYGGGAVTDPSVGTTLTAAFIFTQNGTFSGSFSTAPLATLSIDVNDVETDDSGMGTFVSAPYNFVVGQGPPTSISAEFGLSIGCQVGGCAADFSDPTLTDVAITDPNTGLPVLGITAIGDGGTIYITNAGIAGPQSNPEPSTWLLTAAVIALGFLRTRFRIPRT